MLFCDIDNFKDVNDSCGHQFGDTVLREVGGLLKATLRDIDVAARYGGEEFAIILPGTDRHGGVLAAERIRQVIASHNFGGNSDLPQQVTVSIGVASFPEDSEGREDIIGKADAAMYLAKRFGRNQVRAFRDLKTMPAS